MNKPHSYILHILLLSALLFLPLTLSAATTTAEADSLLAFLYRYMPLPDR